MEDFKDQQYNAFETDDSVQYDYKVEDDNTFDLGEAKKQGKKNQQKFDEDVDLKNENGNAEDIKGI